MKFNKEEIYFLSDPRLHAHLREEWAQGGETEEVIEHMINKLICFSCVFDTQTTIYDIELTYERQIKIYCCYEGQLDDVDYIITINPDRYYRRS